MADMLEADVAEIIYVGPHAVEPDIHLVTIRLMPVPGQPWQHVTLRLRPAEACQLAHCLQVNPPAPAADHLQADVAGHDT